MLRLKNLAAAVACFVLMIQTSRGSEIIGGTEVKPHSLPFMALLMPDCGGTLIHPQWVLTAAHCKNIAEVVLGAHSYKNQREEYRQSRMVAKEFPHPFFDRVDFENDLKLFKLDKPVTKTKAVQWLTLAKTIEDPIAGTRCFVAGWGETDENRKYPQMTNALRAAYVRVVDRKECNIRYNFSAVITRRMVCAGWDGGQKTDTCQGDSGGPLVCDGRQVGVTSFGRKCADPGKPGVYAFLNEKQLKWIADTMNTNDI